MLHTEMTIYENWSDYDFMCMSMPTQCDGRMGAISEQFIECRNLSRWTTKNVLTPGLSSVSDSPCLGGGWPETLSIEK